MGLDLQIFFFTNSSGIQFNSGFQVSDDKGPGKPQYESCPKCKTLFTHIHVPFRMIECEMSGPEFGGAISLKY